MANEVTPSTEVSTLVDSLLPDANGLIFGFKKEVVEIFWLTNAADAVTPAERVYFLSVCQSMALDPRRGHIFFTKRWDSKRNCHRPAIITAVAGLRTIAERSREYVGCVKKEWCGKDGVWKDVWLSDELPVAARAWVARRGTDHLIQAVVLMKHLMDPKSPTWQKMPEHMLGKCAEAAALRAAYPGEVQGIETFEEANENLIDVTPPRERIPEGFERPALTVPPPSPLRDPIDVPPTPPAPPPPPQERPPTPPPNVPPAGKQTPPAAPQGAQMSPPPLNSGSPEVGACLQGTSKPASPKSDTKANPATVSEKEHFSKAPGRKPMPWDECEFASMYRWDDSVVFVKNIESHYTFMFDCAAEFGVPFNPGNKPFLTQVYNACVKMPLRNLPEFVWTQIFRWKNPTHAGPVPPMAHGEKVPDTEVPF
jgi:phage recombination protein Bet